MAAEKEKGAAAAKEVSGGKMITLKSSDGKLFEVPEAEARLSEVLHNMIKDKSSNDIIPLTTIASGALEKVIQYWNKHAEAAAKPCSHPSAAASKDLEKWDCEFVNGLRSQDALFDLIEAANFLEIEGLLDATCRKVSNMMKGKSADQIRETFNIKNDYTVEELKELRQENAWAFDD